MNLKHLGALYRDERYDALIVCNLEPAVYTPIGAKRGRVVLSHATMVKQRARHPDVLPDHYAVLRACLMMGEVRQDTPTSAIVSYTDTVYFGYNFRAAIKAPADGKQIYCVSFCLLRDRQLRQLNRRCASLPILREHE